jgi:hypothetical protein
MSKLAYEYGLMGITMPLPSGQPELQFFSYLRAYLEVWDPTIESWVPMSMGSKIIGIANIYWPISPLVFDIEGPPLLVPENSAMVDMDPLFEMFASVYDDIEYTTDSVIMQNTTLGRYFYYHFDVPTGRMIMMHGWTRTPLPGSEWNFMSIYTKKVETLSTGNNQFSLESDFTVDINVDVELDVIAGPTPQYIYSVIPYNPINASLPNGIGLIFFDQLITNYGQVDGNITIIIAFASIFLSQVELFFFAFNMSGTNGWDQAPPEFYDTIVYDYICKYYYYED